MKKGKHPKFDPKTRAIHRSEKALSTILDKLEKKYQVQVKAVDIYASRCRIVWEENSNYSIGGFEPKRKND